MLLTSEQSPSCEQSMGRSVLTDTDSKLRRWGGDKDALLQVCVKGQRLHFLRARSRNPPPQYGKELVLVAQNSRGKNHRGAHDWILGVRVLERSYLNHPLLGRLILRHG